MECQFCTKKLINKVTLLRHLEHFHARELLLLNPEVNVKKEANSPRSDVKLSNIAVNSEKKNVTDHGKFLKPNNTDVVSKKNTITVKKTACTEEEKEDSKDACTAKTNCN